MVAVAGGVVTAGGPAAASLGPAVVVLAGSAVPFTGQARPLGLVPRSERLSVQVWLRPQTAAAERFAVAVSTPGSPEFQQYLSPARYSARFGATAAAAGRVISWLRSRGFTGVRADAQRSFVRGTASAARIDAALGTQLKRYRATSRVNAGPYPLRANDRPVSVPAALAGTILGVTGLDNAAPVLSVDRQQAPAGGRPGPAAGQAAGPAVPCSHYYGQHLVAGLPRKFGTTRFPTISCGYTARQLRSVYGAAGTAAGRGQTIALVELGLTRGMFRTLRQYAARSGMPAPSASRYAERPVGRGGACGAPNAVREPMDVEASYDMAPGASQLVVGGDSCDHGDFGFQGLIDADSAILDGSGGKPLASVVSNSWTSGQGDRPQGLQAIEHAFLVRAAAEGVGMYFSSGDFSDTFIPASDPFAIAVGGTTLGISRAGHRLFETGWSSNLLFDVKHRWAFPGESGASGGGLNLQWRQPGYQRGVVPASMSTVGGDRDRGPVRTVPDISADADPATGFAVGLLTFSGHRAPQFSEEAAGGTGLAAPLVAGLVTAAQQGQPAPFGFLDPALYRLAGTSAYRDPLPLTGRDPVLWRALLCGPETPFCGFLALNVNDDQSPDLGIYAGQVTAPGYDTMTGVGTPNGPAFTAALRNLERHR